MLHLFLSLALNIFYFCYFTLSVNHNLSLFRQTKLMVWSHSASCKLSLVSQLIQLKMTFSSDHIKQVFKSSVTSSVGWFFLVGWLVGVWGVFFVFFKAAQPHKILVFTAKALCSCFLPPLSVFGGSPWPDTQYLSKQTFLSSASSWQFSSQIPCYPHGFHRAWHSGKSWCEEVEEERGNLQSSEKAEKCEGEASNICACLWACCLTALSGEQEQPLGCCACRVLLSTPLLLYSPEAALLVSLSSRAKLQDFGWSCLLILVFFLRLLASCVP